MSDTRFSIPLGNGAFEISGTDQFVEKQLLKFDEQIRTALDIALSQHRPKSKQDFGRSGNRSTGSEFDSNIDTSNVFEISDGKIHVLKDVPGQSNKERTINAALLYLFGTRTAGVDEANFEPIRNLCKQNGCLDNTNFAKYIKSEKALFVFSGSGRNQTVKLSRPGNKKAAELIRELTQQR